MWTLKTLGLALALAVTELSVSAKAKEAELRDELSLTVTVPPTVPAQSAVEHLPIVNKVETVKEPSFAASWPKPADTSPKVLDVADGRCQRSLEPLCVFQVNPTVALFETSTGGRYVSGLRATSTNPKAHYTSAENVWSSTIANDTSSGSCRGDVPICSGVAPLV